MLSYLRVPRDQADTILVSAFIVSILFRSSAPHTFVVAKSGNMAATIVRPTFQALQVQCLTKKSTTSFNE